MCTAAVTNALPYFPLSPSLAAGIEISDEQAEKIFTANDAIAFLSKEMGVN